MSVVLNGWPMRFLTGTGASGIMFGNVLADQYSGTFNWPFGAVLALIMIAVVFLLLIAASRFTRLDAVFGARA